MFNSAKNYRPSSSVVCRSLEVGWNVCTKHGAAQVIFSISDENYNTKLHWNWTRIFLCRFVYFTFSVFMLYPVENTFCDGTKPTQ